MKKSDKVTLLEDIIWTVYPYTEDRTPKYVRDNNPWIFNLCYWAHELFMETGTVIENNEFMNFCKNCHKMGRAN